MTINELKNLIESKRIAPGTNVWVTKGDSSKYVAWKYLRYLDKPIKIIDKVEEINDDSFIEDDIIYVMVNPKEVPNHDNLIVLMDSYKGDCVVIPELEPWQFVDYLKAKVPGMNSSDIDWLVHLYDVTFDKKRYVNYSRLDKDTDKIALYNESNQNSIFNELYNSGEYDTISNLTMFDLSNAIIRKDVKSITEVLKVRDFIDLKPGLWLLSILLGNFRNLIAIQIGNRTAESIGISDKQYYFIKKNQIGLFTNEQLVNIYDMLTNIEYQFKFDSLDVDDIIDYIILKVFTL